MFLSVYPVGQGDQMVDKLPEQYAAVGIVDLGHFHTNSCGRERADVSNINYISHP